VYAEDFLVGYWLFRQRTIRRRSTGTVCVCSDKCYCEDLADNDKCECSGIPPPVKDKMKSCSVRHVPDDDDFHCNSRSMLHSLQMCKPFWYHCKCRLFLRMSRWMEMSPVLTVTNVSYSPAHHTMSLLERVERSLGPINTWPTYIIQFLFVDIPTPTIVRKLLSSSVTGSMSPSPAIYTYYVMMNGVHVSKTICMTNFNCQRQMHKTHLYK
jgi:hypothetical protein